MSIANGFLTQMIGFFVCTIYLIGNQILDEGFVEDFAEKMETAIRSILYAIQNLAERNSKKTDENTDQTRPQEEDGMSEIRQTLVSYVI